ncbi:MAG: adenylate/guanylate cyclase domain-containing protein, partial [Deltaproteobacteria bacterium]|nr:adenylate/guanylate cyclase domain-containing protein [Deltaproteobacteria bacterium]
MKHLHRLFVITPLKLSLALTLVFTTLMLIYETNPDWSPLLSMLGNRSLDYKFQRRGYTAPRSKIVLVVGDEKSYRFFGQKPWDRGDVFARVIEKVCSYGPKIVGSDIMWTYREKLIAPRLKEKIGLIGGPSGAAMLAQAMLESSGDGYIKQAISMCRAKVVLGYELQRHDADIPKERYNERLAIVLDPRARNSLVATAPPRVSFARFRGDGQGMLPFYQIATAGDLSTLGVTPDDVAQGFMNWDQDADGNFRRPQLLFVAGSSVVPSLPLRMAQAAVSPGDQPPKVDFTPDEIRLSLPTNNGSLPIPVDQFGQAIANFHGTNFMYPNLSMSDLLAVDETVEYKTLVAETGAIKTVRTSKTELLRDAIVLLGYTGAGSGDIRPRPLESLANGTENQATVLDNILAGELMTRPILAHLWLFAGGALLAGLLFGWAVGRLNALWGAGLAAFVLFAGIYLDQVIFFGWHRMIIFGELLGTQYLLQYISITLVKFTASEKEKRQIRSAFDKYVSPAIIDTMLKDPSKLRLGGEKRSLSVLFSDIRGFTSLSERLDVRALTTLLNEYLGAMTNILQANSGTLDKYIGDAVMGFWSAPLEIINHGTLAVKTAIEMLLKLEELNPEFERKYGVRLDIGIGINSGEASVGNFGSEKVFEYTVIGDNVNLASRLEGANKMYGTRIIVSGATFAMLEPGLYPAREIDTIKAKGKNQAVKIYELFPDTPA